MNAQTFTPGAHVAIFCSVRGRQSFVTKRIVDKVYKNGNFTLTGERQQWRPYSNGWQAQQAGRQSTWSHSICELWTPETQAKVAKTVEAQRRERRTRAVIERLIKHRSFVWTIEQIIVAEALASSLEHDRISNG